MDSSSPSNPPTKDVDTGGDRPSEALQRRGNETAQLPNSSNNAESAWAQDSCNDGYRTRTALASSSLDDIPLPKPSEVVQGHGNEVSQLPNSSNNAQPAWANANLETLWADQEEARKAINTSESANSLRAQDSSNDDYRTALASSSLDDIPPPKADYSAPPPYEVATQITKLPTYEEVQREKHFEEELLGIPIVSDPSQFRTPPNQRILLPIDAEAAEDVDTSLLGTDFMFYIAFFVAFIFNWVGFLLLMCFCHTIASRYGALSGFGLSLAKWTFIVQHSTELGTKENCWLWWLIMTFGLIICIRAIMQYLNIKRGWHMLSTSHQERLLFFY